jgi:DNA-3-methyladenine glycosylase I
LAVGLPTKLVKEFEDGRLRCWWPGEDQEYVRYHDREWGFPVHDDVRLFEKICLEGFQSGLSWLTILRKRDNFRRAFAEFDFRRVARFDKRRVEKMLSDRGIVRHRGKIESTINNARRALELVDEFGSLAKFLWEFEPRRKRDVRQCVTTTAESRALSKALKARGWTFVGPTTAYAFMQSVGLVNDHMSGCFVRPLAEQRRRELARP